MDLLLKGKCIEHVWFNDEKTWFCFLCQDMRNVVMRVESHGGAPGASIEHITGVHHLLYAHIIGRRAMLQNTFALISKRGASTWTVSSGADLIWLPVSEAGEVPESLNSLKKDF